MAAFDLIAAPADFDQGSVQILDWAIDSVTGAPMNSGKPVRRRPNLYVLNGGQVTINETGPVARLRYCSQNDYDVNFWVDDGLVVAADPSPTTMPDDTPLLLTFTNPPHGVGAFVTVGEGAVQDDLPLHALMWVLPAGSTQWLAFAGDGITGRALPKGAPAAAAFVGVHSPGPDTISKVCFDATLKGNRRFKKLALSRLFWTP